MYALIGRQARAVGMRLAETVTSPINVVGSDFFLDI